jgi:hypothetical protein
MCMNMPPMTRYAVLERFVLFWLTDISMVRVIA